MLVMPLLPLFAQLDKRIELTMKNQTSLVDKDFRPNLRHMQVTRANI